MQARIDLVVVLGKGWTWGMRSITVLPTGWLPIYGRAVRSTWVMLLRVGKDFGVI